MSIILCIEDEDQIRQNIIEELADAGYETFEASNGQDGIQAIVKHRPDLVLCDITMPKKTGFDILRELRSDYPELSDIPFVFLSALADKKSVIEGMQLGSDDYLIKPIDFDILSVTIKMRLEKVKLRAKIQNEDIKKLENIIQESKNSLKEADSHDPVTGLINRSGFLKILQGYDSLNTIDAPALCVLKIHIDGLTDVNDALGYTIRKKLMQIIRSNIAECISDFANTLNISSDDVVISRLGESEFSLLLDGIDWVTNSKIISENIIKYLSAPIEVLENKFSLIVNMGIANNTETNSKISGLLKNADLACRYAIGDGDVQYKFYDEEWTALLRKTAAIASDLKKAISEDQFKVYYQPRIDVRSGEPIGAEALIRWPHPEKGMIPPGKFISVAESSGLIGPIGDWVLKASCIYAASWSSMDQFSNLDIAVNLSPAQFLDGGLVNKIKNTLDETGLKASRLELEITENMLLEDSDQILRTLYQIRDLGIRIAIDDFGTGYSSLSYLKQIPADIIKIDLSFVENILTNPKDAAISAAIIELGHSHNMGVVAEGVETEEQADYLRMLGCDQFQGYFFSPPLPVDDFTSFIKKSDIKSVGDK